MYNCCHSSTEKKLISRIFSQHRLLGEKRKDTWIYEDKKMQRTLKNRLKTVDLNVPKLVKLEDVTLLCLASSTRPRRRNLLAALAQYTVSHFRSSSTKSSSWFLSSLVMQTRDEVQGLRNCLEFSQPVSCLYQTMQTRKHFLLLL